MRVLLLNQTFHPDVVSTAQHLKDFAVGLAEHGHQVSVIASQRAYDKPEKRFPARESWRGIQIYRIPSSGFGKSAKWKRAVDFATFLLSCLWRLATVPRPDAVVALTSPPLISFIGSAYARLRGCRFVYWVMDLNPDEAVAAGWLRPHSLPTRLLDHLSRFSFRHATRIIALDRFMAARIAAKGISRDKIAIIPPWSHDDIIRFDPAGRHRFRTRHGLQDKFVVMYSGNHSPCHPLTTLLEAARTLASDTRFMFLFVGGGSELPKVKAFAERSHLTNILCLPYQPLDELAGSLSAADLHVVVMGDPFVGTIHPCKIYNILSVGAPVLYIGPDQSHVRDIFADLDASIASKPNLHPTWYAAHHNDVAGVVEHLSAAAAAARRGYTDTYHSVTTHFSKDQLLPKQVALLESMG